MSTATLRRTTCARIPTGLGQFQLCHYIDTRNQKEHLALVHGEIAGQTGVLTRVHSECFTGDVLGSQRCDCGEQLHAAMQMIAQHGLGVIIYLRQEGRGIGLEHKLHAYNLQDQGYDTVDANLMLGHQADEREYSAAAEMLADLQIRSIRLMTNNPDKIESLQALGIDVLERIVLESSILRENANYLSTKVQRMRHMLSLGKPLVQNDVASTAMLNASNGAEVGVANGVETGFETDTTRQTGPNPPYTTGNTTGAVDLALPIQHEIKVLESRAELFHAECRDVDTPQHQRPFVTVTYAQALDGSIAGADSEPMTLSGPESMRMTHMLRTRHDAILVGIGTVLADNPRLTARLVEGVQPQPVILDTHRRIPSDAELFHHPKGVWLATHVNGEGKDSAVQSARARKSTAEHSNLTIFDLPLNPQGHIDLPALLRELGNKGIRRLMVEGGPTVIRAFLAAQLVDYLVVTIAPRFAAGRNVLDDPATDVDAGVRPVLPTLTDVHYTQAGEDTILWAVPQWNHIPSNSTISNPAHQHDASARA